MKSEWVVRFILLLLTFVGFWLRTRHLGELSLYGDEDLTALSALSILEKGYPQMPSGTDYWRAPLYSYCTALFAYVLGLAEWSIRLPSALFGTATIPLFYLLGRHWIGRWPALFAASLLTFSTMHILFSRMARMYVIFLFFFILALYYLIRATQEGKRSYRYLSFGFGLIGITLHELGILLTLLFFMLILIPISDRKNKLELAALGIALILFVGIFGKLQAIGSQHAFGASAQAGIAFQTQTHWGGILGLHHLQFYPKFHVVFHFFQHHPIIYTMIALSIFSSGMLIFRRRLEVKGFSIHLLVSFLSLLNLFGLLAITLIMVGYLMSPWDREKIDRGLAGFLIALALGMFAFWVIYGFMGWRGEGLGPLSATGLFRKVLKEMVYFPAMHIMVFFSSYPALTLVLLAGSLAWFYKQCSGKADHRETFLYLSFWIPLLAMGLTKEWVALRYLFPLYPLYLLIFSAITGSLWTAAKNGFSRGRVYRFQWGIALFLVVLPTLWGGHGIGQAFAVASPDSRQRIPPDMNSDMPVFPDHRGAATFMKAALHREDRVIAMDATQLIYYLGQVDYWLRDWSDAMEFAFLSEGKRKDGYTGAEILYDFNVFREVLCGSSRPVWIITSAEVSGSRYKNLFVPPEVWPFLEMHREKLAWVGQDGLTEVYHFSPGSCTDSPR